MGARLDIDYLTKLNFDRSKKWAGFLKKVCMSETMDVINFHQNGMETVFKESSSCSDSDLSSMEDSTVEKDIPPEVLEDITNCSRMMITMCGRNSSKHFSEMSIKVDDSAKQELFDLLNHTLPVINEYERQMKETGLENVLNTFDTKKIEEKECKWLENKTLQQASINNHSHGTKSCLKSLRGTHNVKIKTRNSKDDSGSDDSLHSYDLARYVRSTKCCTPQQNSLRKIKTFCTTKTKRDILRQKYDCYPDYDETYVTEVKCRRKYRTFNGTNHYQLHYNNGSDQQKLEPRKKVLRKRLVTHRQFDGTESDENDKSDVVIDECTSCCCHHCNHRTICGHSGHSVKKYCRSNHSQKKCCSKMTLTSKKSFDTHHEKRKIDKHCNKHHKMLSSSTSFLSTSTQSPESTSTILTRSRSGIKKVKDNYKFSKNFMSDPRPCKRETECQCYNQDKLCPNYKHIADASNENWFVENYYPTMEPLECTYNERPSIMKRKSSKLLSKADKRNKITMVKKKADDNNQEYTEEDEKAEARFKESLKSFKQKQTVKQKTTITECEMEFNEGKNNNRKEIKRSCTNDGKGNVHMNFEVVKKIPKLNLTMSKNKFNDKNVECIVIDSDELPEGKEEENERVTTFNYYTPGIHNSTALKKNHKAAAALNKKNLNTIFQVEETGKKLTEETNTHTNDNNKSLSISNVTLSVATSINRKAEESSKSHNNYNNDTNDCTVVSSTTQIAFKSESNKELNDGSKVLPGKSTAKGILLYCPEDKFHLAPKGYFEVTKDYLSTIIGANAAKKFFKYHVGRCRFNSASTVYFRPPPPTDDTNNASITTSTTNHSNIDTAFSSDEDDDSDVLERFGRYGLLYESLKSDLIE